MCREYVPLTDFEKSWVCWTFIDDAIGKEIFDFNVKRCAFFLVNAGCQSRFIKTLAFGNLQFPDDVIEQALDFERMDRILR